MAKLAINGGTPLIPMESIKEQWPIITQDDIDAVVETLKTGKVSWMDNEEVSKLEKMWANYMESDYCIALNSGTAALHAAVAAAGVEPGDEVIVPSLTFLASASSVIHHQGIPVFVDIDPDTFTMDAQKIEEKITSRTRAIIVVHLSGLPADMDPIMRVAEKYDLKVIEDAAQAHGALYKGRKAGSIGDIGAYSIMAGKNLPTAGEGGLLTTNDIELRNKADMVKMFGEKISLGETREFNAHTMGWNYRFSSILAAFTKSQLKRMDYYTSILQENATYLSEKLKEIPGVVPPYVPSDRTHVYHHYRFKLDPKSAGLDLPEGVFRKAIQEIMGAEGLTLIEYQNRPIPGQILFKNKIGYGKGCPWTCGFASRDVTYDGNDYPETNKVLRSSLLIGSRLCLSSFLERKNIDMYIDTFYKVFENLEQVYKYAKTLEGEYDPMKEVSRLF